MNNLFYCKVEKNNSENNEEKMKLLQKIVGDNYFVEELFNNCNLFKIYNKNINNDQKVYICNEHGEKILEFSSKDICAYQTFNNEVYFINDKVFDQTGREIFDLVELNAKDVYPLGKDLFAVCDKELDLWNKIVTKSGTIIYNNNMIKKPFRTKNNLIALYNDEDKISFMSDYGKIIQTPCKFTEYSELGSSNDIIKVYIKKGNKEMDGIGDNNLLFCFLDKEGKEIFPYHFLDNNRSDKFNEGIMAVNLAINDCPIGNHEYIRDWIFITEDGNILNTIDFNDTIGFSQKLAAVKINGELKFIDINGNLVDSNKYNTVLKLPIFEDIALDNFAFAVCDKNNYWGVINNKGEEYFPCIFKDLNELSQYLIRFVFISDMDDKDITTVICPISEVKKVIETKFLNQNYRVKYMVQVDNNKKEKIADLQGQLLPESNFKINSTNKIKKMINKIIRVNDK